MDSSASYILWLGFKSRSSTILSTYLVRARIKKLMESVYYKMTKLIVKSVIGVSCRKEQRIVGLCQVNRQDFDNDFASKSVIMELYLCLRTLLGTFIYNSNFVLFKNLIFKQSVLDLLRFASYMLLDVEGYCKICLPTYMPTYLHIYLPTCLPTYMPTYLHAYLPTCLSTYLPTYMPIYIPTHMPSYLPTWLPTHMPTCRHVYLPTYLPTYLHAYLPTCLYTYLPTYVGNHANII